MNKMNAIKKINKIGKVGKIVTIIALIGSIIGVVGATAGGAIISTLPKNGFEMNVNSGIEINVDASAFDENIDTMSEEEIFRSIAEDTGVDFGSDAIQSGSVNIENQEFKIDDVSVDNNVISIKGTTAPQKMTFNNLVIMTVLIDISMLALIVSLVFGKNLCKAFETCESPFEDNVIKKMRYFAFSLIPWTILSSIPTNVADNLFGSGLKINAGIDLGVVFVVLVILALTYIFQYGSVLQRESDETL